MALAVGVAVASGEAEGAGASVGSGGGVLSAARDATGVGLGATVGVEVALAPGVAAGVAAAVGSGGGVRSAGLDGSGSGVDVTINVAVGVDDCGREMSGVTVVGVAVLGLESGDVDEGVATWTTNAVSADALKRPSAPLRTSSVDPNTIPGRPSPASERSKEILRRSSIPVAVSVNLPPGSIDVMSARYVPGTALGSSMSCGSLPGALAAQPGTWRTIVVPDELMPHDRPSGSTTTRIAGECMPKRNVVEGVGI